MDGATVLYSSLRADLNRLFDRPTHLWNLLSADDPAMTEAALIAKFSSTERGAFRAEGPKFHKLYWW
jgi:hypothetical protein